MSYVTLLPATVFTAVVFHMYISLFSTPVGLPSVGDVVPLYTCTRLSASAATYVVRDVPTVPTAIVVGSSAIVPVCIPSTTASFV